MIDKLINLSKMTSRARTRQRVSRATEIDTTLLFGEQTRETVEKHHSNDPFAIYDKKDLERLNSNSASEETQKHKYDILTLNPIPYSGPAGVQGDRKVLLPHTTIKVSSCNGYRTSAVKCKSPARRGTKVTSSRVTRM